MGNTSPQETWNIALSKVLLLAFFKAFQYIIYSNYCRWLMFHSAWFIFRMSRVNSSKSLSLHRDRPKSNKLNMSYVPTVTAICHHFIIAFPNLHETTSSSFEKIGFQIGRQKRKVVIPLFPFVVVTLKHDIFIWSRNSLNVLQNS